jgi:cell wall-associated NlpC family hydrolase
MKRHYLFVKSRRFGCSYFMKAQILGTILMTVMIFSACTKRETAPIHTGSNTGYKSYLPTIAYTIQLGAFKSSLRAQRLVKKLRNDGVDAYFYEDNGRFTKVRLGCFDTLKSADRQAAKLKRKGLIDTYYIVKPNNTLIVKPKDTLSPNREKSEKDPRKKLEQRLVKTARRFIGVPYRWGGESVAEGFDCSGLTMTVYRLNGLDLPRKAALQYLEGVPVSLRSLKHGDLVFFATNGDGRISHVGIYSGEGKFIHAPGRGKTIQAASLSNVYFKKHYRGARRYF